MGEIGVVITEIPIEYHSKDLRNFFFFSVEKEFFACFNYRKRPHESKKYNLALLKIKSNKYDQFYQMYDSKSWVNHLGQVSKTKLKCKIFKIKKFEDKNLEELIEFRNIPQWMPQGNVGTPTKIFIKYINQCKMPSSLIHKLGINLKHHKKCVKKQFTNVEFKYQDNNEQNDDESSENELEDWERHESLHDDVTKQDRTSPYLFENEIELKWEKGGSGLVFYTDDNFWKDHEGKDFDAETADDWDLDMRCYNKPDECDMDERDLIDMRKQEMLRNGADPHLISDKKNYKILNPFDKAKRTKFDSNSFARRQLERFGWKEGDRIGMPNRSGLLEALDASDGKNPMDKTGIGYHGEKVDKNYLIKLKKDSEERERRNSDFYIGSKYDTDPNRFDTLLNRFEPTLKYRTFCK